MLYPKRNIRINPITNVSSATLPSLEDFVLEINRTEKYKFPICDEVPPAMYSSRVDFVEPSLTARKQPAVDVCYSLINADGDLFHIRQRYPKDSIYYLELVHSLCKAGAPPGKNISEAVGIIENIKIGYPTESEIGSITKRIPYPYKEGETPENMACFFEELPDD